MDEPFGAVDPIVRGRLQDELLRLQEMVQKTIVIVTHDIDEAIKLADRVALLNVGGIVEQYAPPDEILAAPASEFVEQFVGQDRSQQTPRARARVRPRLHARPGGRRGRVGGRGPRGDVRLPRHLAGRGRRRRLPRVDRRAGHPRRLGAGRPAARAAGGPGAPLEHPARGDGDHHDLEHVGRGDRRRRPASAGWSRSSRSAPTWPRACRSRWPDDRPARRLRPQPAAQVELRHRAVGRDPVRARSPTSS